MASRSRLQGIVSARLDDRKRVAVPAKMIDAFRAVAEKFGAGEPMMEPLEVVVGIDEELNLAVFPKYVHEALLVELAERKPTSTNRKIRRFVTGYMEEMQLDKQNRFRIPEPLMKSVGIESEVWISGNGDRLVVSAATKAADELADAMADRDALLAKADEDLS